MWNQHFPLMMPPSISHTNHNVFCSLKTKLSTEIFLEIDTLTPRNRKKTLHIWFSFLKNIYKGPLYSNTSSLFCMNKMLFSKERSLYNLMSNILPSIIYLYNKITLLSKNILFVQHREVVFTDSTLLPKDLVFQPETFYS